MRLSAGARLGGYEIVAPIGAGGMGEVHRARDTRLKRDVAIKVLPAAWADDPDRVLRFQREAELLAALNHPNIALIYGVEAVDSAARPAITALILELVEGPTLADCIARGPVPLDEALAIGRQIADALEAAHEKGIVHRDLKPGNIKVRADGAVKVLDFGLAKALEPETAAELDAVTATTMTSPAMTHRGVMLGTAAYMSPEQARGQAIDRRTDVWAFGCVLYEMLTGRPAFVGPTVPDLVAAVLEREPDWSALPSSTPPSMLRLIRRCLEKDRRRRLRDIGDARYELDEIERDAIAPRPDSRRLPASWLRPLLAAAILTSLLALTVVMWNRGAPRARLGGVDLGPEFSRLTSDGSYSTEPALSDDGTLVVYASDRATDGQLDLWLQRTAGGQPIRLTNDSADDRQPDFSPDGRFIAFRSDRGTGGIYVMPALGGDARLVAEGGRRPRFSPDGATIAYWTGPWLSGSGARGRGSAVFTVPAIGGRPAPIAEGFLTSRDPVWSADGRSLLFFGRKSADDSASSLFDWWWAPLDRRDPVPTGAYRVLADAGLAASPDTVAADVALEPVPTAWTEAGVLFSARLGESVNLWRLEISESSGQMKQPLPIRLTHGAGSDRAASVDRSGRVAFQVASEGRVSLTLPLDSNAGKALGPIVRRSYEAAAVWEGRNSLDHAGRLLVYPRGRRTETEIWVKDLTTGQERHLVTAPASRLDPVISPDGAKVAYIVSQGKTVEGYVVPTSGGTARKVCDSCILNGWFSDNHRILVGDAAGNSRRLRALDVVDGKTADLAIEPTGNLGRADVSPNNRWLSFSARSQVWIAPLRPGDPPPPSEWVSVLQIAENSAERACGWSPDSRLLYLLLERDGFRDLYAQRVDPVRGTPVGEPFVVQHLHDPRRRWGSTPLGTAIVGNAFVFNQIESEGSIWMLDPR